MKNEPGRAPSFPSLPLTERLRIRSELLFRLRRFFRNRRYIEVESPLRVLCPGIEPQVDAFPAGEGLWLATSPELHMKRLVAMGAGRIFQLTRAFRAREIGERHYGEFTILEWYRPGASYIDLMDETETLVGEVLDALPPGLRAAGTVAWPRPFRRLTVDRAFRENAGWVPSAQPFEPDRFFLDLVEKVEPNLEASGAVFLYDFPASLASLARRRIDDDRLAERFELYLDGLEVCNGATELADPVEQRARFVRDNLERQRLGKEPYPIDERFLASIEAGLPACAGNAIGVDRLLMALAGCRRMEDVTAFAREDGPGRTGVATSAPSDRYIP